MQRLKKHFEVSKEAINESIVQIQSEIDELYKQYLENPFDAEVKNKMEMKEKQKHHQYGWLGATVDALEKIEESEKQDELDFELALEQLEVTERELKADA